MTLETPDPFDTDLQTLFAGIHPPADFEDRLVNMVRQQRRLRLAIPGPVIKAAIAAAAVLAVGTVGYYGNLALTGSLHFRQVANRDKVASNLHQLGLAIQLYDGDAKVGNQGIDPFAERNAGVWDFGGGSNSAQNWSTSISKQTNLSYSYANPFANNKAISNSWQMKNPDASYGIAGDINPGLKQEIQESLRKRVDPYDSDTLYTYNATNDRSAGENQKVPAPQIPAAVVHGLELKGVNAYTGYTNINGGTLALGSDAPFAHQRAVHQEDGQNYLSSNGSVDFAKEQTPPVSAAAATNAPAMEQSKIDALRKSIAAVNTFDSQADQAAPSPVAADKTVVVPVVPNKAIADQQSINGPITFEAATDSPTIVDAVTGRPVKGDVPPVVAVPQAPPTNPVTAPSTTAPVIDDRKIIRTGTMEFEVDRFDTAQVQITKIVGELGGFVGATDSTKLPNGKVRGSISVRVPPERLDTLVLSLRALGDLKSQQITAADITKEYTDIQSELTADRAMQDRLLELIHNGKGSVKDLLAAENELGTWRSKIEKAEGMIRYYNGQISLSTLSITLSERDIQTPATAVETETADMGIEADDVEKARTSALKAIDDVKGRVVEAELKRYDAGQLAARLVADVPPESAGAVIDQLKLLGKVARLEIHRQETNSDGTTNATSTTPLKTEQKATRLLVSIYNLANVAPRRTTNVSLAAADVEAAYNALVAAAKTNGGRVVTSALDRGDPSKASGSLVLEFPPDKFESAMTALHAQGDVLKLTLTENPDTQNSTEAKVGLTVQLVSLAAVPPRESIQQTLAATDVPTAYQSVVNAASAAHARVQSAQLNEQDRQNVTADLQLEIPRSAGADFDKALAAAGGSIARTSNRAAEAEGTVDSKVSLHLSITSADHLAPRETTRLQVETADVDKSSADAQAAAVAAGGRVLEASVTKDHGKGLARIILDLPLDKAGEVLQQVRGEGTVRGIDASRDAQAPAGALAHAQIFVEFTTGDAIVADQTGPWASIRQGLSTSVAGLLWSLQWVIVGVCLIVPWVGIGWVGWKIWKRRGRAKGSVA